LDLRLQPTEKQIEDFKTLCASESLGEAANRLLNTSYTALSPADAKRYINELAGSLTPDQREALFRQVMGLRSIMTRGEFGSDAILRSLRDALGRTGEFSESDLTRWKNHVEPALSKILDSRFFKVVSKAANLAYDYAYLLRTARIITDARPVFSEIDGVADKIEGFVVSHVLRLEFENEENQKSMSIVLDHLDVRKLRDACNRALQKAEVVEKIFATCDIPAKITGQESQ
jgi:hypothetical protein